MGKKNLCQVSEDIKEGQYTVVTKNARGAIVAVTRQDEDGKILHVIAESDPWGLSRAVWPEQSSDRLQNELAKLHAVGKDAASVETILENCRNTLRHSQCLAAVAQELLGNTPEDNHPAWGDEPNNYAKKFKAALDKEEQLKLALLGVAMKVVASPVKPYNAKEGIFSAVIGDPNWYCDQWPGLEHIIVFFYDAGDDNGVVPRYRVDTAHYIVESLL